jgi:hypothetical protein
VSLSKTNLTTNAKIGDGSDSNSDDSSPAPAVCPTPDAAGQCPTKQLPCVLTSLGASGDTLTLCTDAARFDPALALLQVRCFLSVSGGFLRFRLRDCRACTRTLKQTHNSSSCNSSNSNSSSKQQCLVQHIHMHMPMPTCETHKPGAGASADRVRVGLRLPPVVVCCRRIHRRVHDRKVQHRAHARRRYLRGVCRRPGRRAGKQLLGSFWQLLGSFWAASRQLLASGSFWQLLGRFWTASRQILGRSLANQSLGHPHPTWCHLGGQKLPIFAALFLGHLCTKCRYSGR